MLFIYCSGVVICVLFFFSVLHLFDSALHVYVVCVCFCVSLSEKCSVLFLFRIIYISGHQFDFGVISLVVEDLKDKWR